MTSQNDSRWQLSFTAVQALGAVVGVVGFLLPSDSLWTRFIRSVLAVTFVGVVIGWFVLARRRAAHKPSEAETSSDVQRSTVATGRVHCFVPLTIWSAVAGMVIIQMSYDVTALLLVALAPLWVTILAIAATRVSRHRASVIMMSVVFCGLFGAWLGSSGDSGARLGFVWYSLAGYLVARAVDKDNTVSIVDASICTVLFVLLTGLILGRYSFDVMMHPSGYIRSGFPFLAFEAYLFICGRWMVGVWLPKSAALQAVLSKPSSTGMPEGQSNAVESVPLEAAESMEPHSGGGTP